MKLKELKHKFFTCKLPENFIKKFPERLGCCAFTPFEFSPLPETFRREFWFTLGSKADIDASTKGFASAYAKFIQEGFTSPFTAEEIKIQSYKATKLTYPELKQFKISEEETIKYQLETQAIALFLEDQHILHIYFSYDISNKIEAIKTLEMCLDSLTILGNATLWQKAITKEKKDNEIFWAEQEEEKKLKERSQRIIKDPKLGTLKHNPDNNLKPKENTWWSSEMAFDTFYFTLQLDLGINDSEEDKVRTLATQLLDNFEINEQKTKQFITDEFLAAYNDGWREIEERPLSEIEFKNRVQLSMLEIDKNLECRFWYNDDDLFGQHALLVSFTIDQKGIWKNISTEMFG
jgi:hypothetical protein